MLKYSAFLPFYITFTIPIFESYYKFIFHLVYLIGQFTVQ